MRAPTPPALIDQFVQALRGKRVSVREIDALTHGFFRGPESFCQEVLEGNLCLPLEQMQTVPEDPDGCSEFERIFLQDLEQSHKGMLRVIWQEPGFTAEKLTFLAQYNLLTAAMDARISLQHGKQMPGFL